MDEFSPVSPEEEIQKIRRYYIAVYRNFHPDSSYGEFPIPKWDGGYDKYGKCYKPVWPKILNFLKEKNCSDYIGFFIANFREKKKVYPSQLYNNNAWKIYERFRRSMEHEIKNQYKAELETFKSANKYWANLSNDESVIERLAISDSTISLSPLFRYILAKSYGFKDLEKRYEHAALSQYITAKDLYDKYWPKAKEILSESLESWLEMNSYDTGLDY